MVRNTKCEIVSIVFKTVRAHRSSQVHHLSHKRFLHGVNANLTIIADQGNQKYFLLSEFIGSASAVSVSLVRQSGIDGSHDPAVHVVEPSPALTRVVPVMQ